jgi:AcrR family transcriptional regulator
MSKRRRLSRERVIEQAVEMADEAGSVEAVSLTALARALQVRVPSLYNHVTSLEDLRRAMTIYAMHRLVITLREATAGREGRDALLAIAHASRKFALAHPGVYPLTIRAPEPADETFNALANELLQWLFLMLATCGLQGDEAIHALRGFRSVLHGFVALETAGGFQLPLSRDESFQRLVESYLNGLVPLQTEEPA